MNTIDGLEKRLDELEKEINETKKVEIYLLCPRAGNPRKHIEVCRRCRYKKRCTAFQEYFQPELPFLSTTRNNRIK